MSVLLDVRRDRYHRLGARISGRLTERTKEPSRAHDPGLRALETADLLDFRGDALDALAWTEASPLTESLLDQGDGSDQASARDIWFLSLRLIATAARLKTRGLQNALTAHGLGASRAASSQQESIPIQAIAARYRKAAQLLPVRPKCLISSLMLSSFARECGASPSLVFGVQLRPFTAHCWLQDGAIVLNDTIEHCSAFTPILVIG